MNIDEKVLPYDFCLHDIGGNRIFSCEQNQFDKALREYELIVTKWEHKGDNNGNDEFLKMKEEFICIIAEVEYYAKENGISEFQHKRLNQLNKRMYKLVLKEY